MPTVKPDRKLASIEKVTNLVPIKGADRIELATVLGWQVIVKKGEFNVGDLGVYFGLDSVLDNRIPEFSTYDGKKIKTIKMRGVLSQGLMLSFGTLTSFDFTDAKEGDDVSEKLKVMKYVDEEEQELYESNVVFKPFCPLVPKTDEPRIQNNPEFIDMISDKEIVVTRKEDGTSCTFIFYNGEFSICSRNYTLCSSIPKSSKFYFEIEYKFNIEKSIREAGLNNIAIQGEIVGPSINGNRLGLTYLDFRVFNIYDIENKKYYDWDKVEELCSLLKLNTVPVLYRGRNCTSGKTIFKNLQDVLDYANKTKYSDTLLAEGIVVSTIGQIDRIHFKAISNEFLLNKK